MMIFHPWRLSIPVGVVSGFSVEIKCEKQWC